MVRIAAIALLIACAAATVGAQTATSTPDVAITATVKARELKFEIVPKVTVTFIGEQNATVWKTDRTNLPDQVQPNVIYRDIGIRLTISSTLPDIESIVDEALAEPAPRPASKPDTKKKK